MKTLISITPDAGRRKRGKRTGQTGAGCLWRRARGSGLALAAVSACGLVLLCPLPSQAGPLDPLAFPSLGTLSLADGSGSYTIDTSGPTPTLRDAANNVLFTGTALAQPTSTFDPTIAVFDFASVYIGSGVQVQVSGTNPLALLSQSTVNIQGGTINANGQNGQGHSGGAGGPGGGAGGDGGSDAFPKAGGFGKGPGGGVPGFYFPSSQGGGGGFGGNGGLDRDWGYTAGLAYGDLNGALEGGSGGGGSGDNGVGGGGGGGAVEIGAITEILGGGAVISARGGTGLSASPYPGISWVSGAGSGGGLFLHAPQIQFAGTSVVSANGGGGLGGGGRILFLTTTGALDGMPATLGVDAGGALGFTRRTQPGAISFGVLGGGPTAAPEPTTALLVGAGLLTAFARRRRTG